MRPTRILMTLDVSMVNFALLMFVTHIKPDATFLCLLVPIDNVTSSILRSVITIVEEPHSS